MQHVTIFRDPSIYASHASACVAKNGDILVAFRQAPLEHVFAHVHPRATVGLVRSTDGGAAWDAANKQTILDPGEEMNLNDPSLTTLTDGTIILTVFAFPCPYARNKYKYGDEALPVRGNDYYYIPKHQQILLRRSFDSGQTWDGPYAVDTGLRNNGGGVFAPVVEMSDGSLLMPISGADCDGNQAAVLIRSIDGGRTWEPYSTISRWESNDRSDCFGLPTVVAFDDRHMLAAGWSVIQSGTVISRSSDGGRTWTTPESVHTDGACMHLCVTDSGTTVLSYGYRNPPYGIRVLPSYDRGVTWDTDKIAALRSDGAMRDLGYPRTIQLPNKRLLCVYYFNVFDEDKSYYDEQASLRLCEQWKLDPELYTYKTAGLRFIGGTLFTEQEMEELAGNTTDQAEGRRAEPTLI